MFAIDSEALGVCTAFRQREEVQIGAGIRVAAPIDMNRIFGRRRRIGTRVCLPAHVRRDSGRIEARNALRKIRVDCFAIFQPGSMGLSDRDVDMTIAIGLRETQVAGDGQVGDHFFGLGVDDDDVGDAG